MNSIRKTGPNRPGLRRDPMRRRKRIRSFLNRMRERQRQRLVQGSSRPKDSLRTQMRKRKAALTLSAGVMGLSTVAADYSPAQAVAITQMMDGLQDANNADPFERRDASTFTSSDAFKLALVEEEGVRYTVYRDVAGYPTVGVGHLVTPHDNLRVGDRISEDQALNFLEQDLKIAEEGVVRLVGDLPVSQHEFDALVDLVYNVGEGNVSERKSPKLNAAINAGDYDGIAEELAYHHAAGSKANGLVYRSDRRTQIFMDGNYENPRDLNA